MKEIKTQRYGTTAGSKLFRRMSCFMMAQIAPMLTFTLRCVTLLCIVFKVLCLAQSWAFPDGFDAFWFGVWMTMERLTDCLDGELPGTTRGSPKLDTTWTSVLRRCFRYSGVAILCYRLAPILPNPWALLTLLLCPSRACTYERL